MLAPLVVAGTSTRVLADIADPEALLAPYERERAAAFRAAEDAADFIAAHVLVRQVAARWLGTARALTLSQRCPRCDQPHGPPSIVDEPDVAVSLSHSRGYVAAAAGTGPLGVDVETPRRGGNEVLDGVLAPDELRMVRASADPPTAFLELWVRKESLIKAGLTTLDSLATVDLAADLTRWGGLQLAGWHAAGGQLGACASTAPATLELLD